MELDPNTKRFKRTLFPSRSFATTALESVTPLLKGSDSILKSATASIFKTEFDPFEKLMHYWLNDYRKELRSVDAVRKEFDDRVH